MKPIVVEMAKGMLEFKRIWLWYLAILVASVEVFLFSQGIPIVNGILAASRNTPWGVFTSIFVHQSWGHLVINMTILLLFVMFFTSMNSTLSISNKRKYQKFFMIAAFIFAVVSNILWVALNTGSTVGASGLAYGVIGIVTSSSILNGLQILSKKQLNKQSTQTVSVILMNIILGSTLVFQVFQNPQVFLNINQGVNIIVHGVSFVLGLSFILPLYLLLDVSIFE